jgi:protein TonB
MTVAADRFGMGERTALGRWTCSLLVVLALHAVIASLLLSRRVAIEPAAAPPAAVMIDLAPLPPAVPAELLPAEATRPPPEPEPPTLAEPEPMPVSKPATVPPPPPEPVPAPQPAVTLPLPQPKLKLKPKPKPRTVDRLPPPEHRPIALPAAPQPVPAPAQQAALPPSPSATAAARTTWQAQLLAWLSRHKRYPRAAQEERQQGTAHLRFALDRRGRVLSFRLDRSSGFAALDEEVTSLIQRAQPLPPPPAEVPGERFELVVPVEFSLDRYRR